MLKVTQYGLKLSLDTPNYDLDDVKQLAMAGKLTPSPSASRDAGNLDYTHKDLCETIRSLGTENCRGKFRDDPQLDVYALRRIAPSIPDGGNVEHFNDELYIKFKLMDFDDETRIYLASFHRNRNL